MKVHFCLLPLCDTMIVSLCLLMSSSVVMTSSDMLSSSSLTTPQPTTVTHSLSPEERVWNKIMVTQEQAAEIERKTRYQSKSLSWYEERSGMREGMK